MMVATSARKKNTKAKYHNVGLLPDVMKMLNEVCEARGWNYGEAVKRMTIREQAALRQEASLHSNIHK